MDQLRSPLDIIPAIDIKDGKVVRLIQGMVEKMQIYSLSPVDVAIRWSQEGARIVHVVDLDGAFEGRAVNKDLIKMIIDKAGVSIQVGGGLRRMEDIKDYLSWGVERIILGTSAVEDANFVSTICSIYPRRVYVAMDVKSGKVAIKGWRSVSDYAPEEFIRMMEGRGVGGIVYTDISRDGTLKGPNIDSLKRVLDNTKIPVIVSGGISSLSDIESILDIGAENLEGIIIGKALYTGTISLRDAIDLVKKKSL